MGKQEQIPAKKPIAKTNDFDIPADIGVSNSSFGLFEWIKDNASYFAYGLLIILILVGVTYLNDTSDLAGQLGTTDAVSTVADEDVLSRFATDELDQDIPDADDDAGALPPPPSISTRGSADTSSTQTEGVIDLTASDFEFSQTEIEVQAGELVQINFEVESGTHSFVIDNVVESKTLNAGESELLEFTVLQDAELIFYCSLHPMMTGKIKVAGALEAPETDSANNTSDLDADIDALLSGETDGSSSELDAALDQDDDFSQDETDNSNSNSSLASNTQSQVMDSQAVMGNSGSEAWFLLLIFTIIYFVVKPKAYV